MLKMLLFWKRMYRTQRQNLGVLIMAIICLLIFYFTFDKGKSIIEDLGDTNRMIQKRRKENVEHERGTGCNMPDLDPFSEEIMNFSTYVPNFTCEGTDWVTCNKSKCYVVKEVLKNMKDVVCTYRDIIYVNDLYYYIGNPVKLLGEEIYTLNRSDHVKIACSGTELHGSDILSSQWYGYKAGFRPVETMPIPPGRQDSYNVMILCFDSTSRNGFIREMRKTYKYLSEKLKAVVLNSYNIVGDGTTGALYPLFTGKGEEEYIGTRRQSAKNLHIDNTDFIFHLLKLYGYRTAYFEDMPWIGTFQNKFNAFHHQPADHYLRSLLMDETSKGEKKLNTAFPARHCIGAIPYYQLMLNLAEEFLQLDGKKFCFTFISDISHDYFDLLSTSDDAVLKFLQTLASRRAFENTLLIVMADHGSRYNGIRDTYQGKLEERLPLMAILLPEKLKRLRPDALVSLKNNKDVLTTPFDIHTTVLDILDFKNESIMHKIPGSDLPRALSLLKPIPKSRSCAEAGVMPHWCACIKWYNVSQTDPMYYKVANLLAEYIDNISAEQRSKCAKRALISTEWVLRQSANDKLLKYSHINVQEIDRFIGNSKSSTPRASDEYYQAKIIMSPGRSVFEGTIYSTVEDDFIINERDISRVNAYKDEPSCVSETHPHLSKFCYCKDRLHQLGVRKISFKT